MFWKEIHKFAFQYLRRIFHFRQMDFEFALWQVGIEWFLSQGVVWFEPFFVIEEEETVLSPLTI